MIRQAHMYAYVIMAPGQGVQHPGMLDPWLGGSPRAGRLLDEWSGIAGLDMRAASQDEDLLSDTAVAQPLIVAAALLSMDVLTARLATGSRELLFAGHSFGELAAAAGAGYLRPATAIGLARTRGLAMSAACAASRTGMAAVMPAKRDPAPDEAIFAAIRAAGLTVANGNGSHQFVAAGPADRLEAFAAAPPGGVRIAPLEVAGAFHTQAMAAAVGPFAQAVWQSPFTEPASAMLSNGDGSLVAGPDDLRQRLVAQITSPVRWDLCSAAMAELSSPDAVRIELAPAGPLTRLTERASPGARAVALRAPHDADRLQPVASPGQEQP
jgi:[acyl-carrier-protein] S-malonyltransferase